MSYKWPLVKIDNIKDPEKYSCVGGPFGSSLSRKHYIETEGVPVLRGVNLGGDQFFDGDFVYVSEQKATELYRNMAYPNDVVFTQRGTLGQVAIIPQKPRYSSYVVSQSQMKLTVNSEITDPYYVYSYFRTEQAKQQIETHAIVGGVPHINLGILKDLEIPFPPLTIQKQIVGIIRSLDEKIILNTLTNQTLEKMAQAIFKSWFVDFDPVKAKMSGEQPVGMDEATAVLFPDKLVESELGLIPEGWEVKKIGDVIERYSVGKKYSQKTAVESGLVPILDQGKSGIIGYHNNKPGVKASLDDPIIVFANHTCYMKLVTYDFSAIQNVLPFKLNGCDIYWSYLATQGKQRFVEYKGHWPDFITHEIVIPSKALMQRFGELVKPFYSQMASNENQNKSLAKLRDTLLPKLLSGEIKLVKPEELAEVS